jgi:excisionase family DNA binding protein
MSSPSSLTNEGQSYLSIHEAARRLGVTARSIYGYIESGKLPATPIEGLLMVEEEAVQRFRRRAPGRLRVKPPRWRKTPEMNQMRQTRLTVRLYPGAEHALAAKLEEMQAERTHCFPGTSARYIVQSHNDPAEVEITLFWRGAVTPSEQEREMALEALRAELAELLDWEHAQVSEGQVLLHA